MALAQPWRSSQIPLALSIRAAAAQDVTPPDIENTWWVIIVVSFYKDKGPRPYKPATLTLSHQNRNEKGYSCVLHGGQVKEHRNE